MTKLIALFCVTLLIGCTQTTPQPFGQQLTAHFDTFIYSGNDPIFSAPLAKDEYQNPILAGYHPDPSVVRVGADYYMVNSTFGFFPGLPVFHSTDLVNWRQLGNAIHRPEQMSFDGIHLGQNGLYAPAIEHNNGTFYVINTCVACGGNFVVTATNPAGPWSNPIWLPHIHGIDPSLFFDDDGKTYVVHHKNPANKRYPAHTALWVMEVDPSSFKPLSEDVMLVDGGEKAPWHTEYIEGPHIYKVDETYYLSAPGGGTGYYHGQLVYKSKNVFGPYEANPNNPILTQLGLPDDRPNPVTATGHADLFEDSNGDWWAVFLGTRVYDLATPPQDPGKFHTGRETFMLPVTWQNGWPTILKGKPVPYRVQKPNLPAAKINTRPTTGNYTITETFDNKALAPQWLYVRTPHTQWWQVESKRLHLLARDNRIGDKVQPSFIGQRLAHMNATIETTLQFTPQTITEEAGLLALQNDTHFYAFGLGINKAGAKVLRIRKKAGDAAPTYGTIISEVLLNNASSAPVTLRLSIRQALINFEYSTDGKRFSTVLENADASVLTTAKAGGFTGAVVGMYAEGPHQ